MDKKLFELTLGTPTDTDLIAYGKTGNSYKNITVANFRTIMQGETAIHKFLTAPIGAWNMKTTSSSSFVGFFFPLAPGEFFSSSIQVQQIRGVSAIIIHDNGTAYSDFLSVQNGTALTIPQIQLGQFTFIWSYAYALLSRRAGSFYESTDYQKTANPDSSPYNRGWVTVTYVDE